MAKKKPAPVKARRAPAKKTAKKKTAPRKSVLTRETPPEVTSSNPFLADAFTDVLKAKGAEVSRRSERMNEHVIHHHIKHEDGSQSLEIEYSELPPEE